MNETNFKMTEKLKEMKTSMLAYEKEIANMLQERELDNVARDKLFTLLDSVIMTQANIDTATFKLRTGKQSQKDDTCVLCDAGEKHEH